MNVLPIIVTIAEQADEDMALAERIVHAAVHGWMEGHLSAPGHVAVGPVREGPMPSPPFPDPDDPDLARIVEETIGRFRDGEEAAAVAYVVALGWQAGRATAGECSGCMIRAQDPELAAALRAGGADIRFVRR